MRDHLSHRPVLSRDASTCNVIKRSFFYPKTIRRAVAAAFRPPGLRVRESIQTKPKTLQNMSRRLDAIDRQSSSKPHSSGFSFCTFGRVLTVGPIGTSTMCLAMYPPLWSEFLDSTGASGIKPLAWGAVKAQERRLGLLECAAGFYS